MNTVYILGAGASHDLRVQFNTIDASYGTYTSKNIAVKGSLSSGYFYYFNQLHKTVKSATSPSLCHEIKASDVLIKYVCDKYDISTSDLLESKVVSQRVNIEKLYIDIESMINEMEEKRVGDIEDFSLLRDKKFVDLMTVQHDLVNYIFSSLSFTGYYCISKLHNAFAGHIVNTGGNIISFNWDTLLDEAMYHTTLWSYEKGYGVDFERAVYKDSNSTVIGRPRDVKNIILKPHGSINWYSDIHNERLYLVLPVGLKLRGGTFGQLKTYESIGDCSVHAHIVPPGKKRKQFPDIWNHMRSLLRDADKIIAIGFSFNSNDNHVIEEFDHIGFKKDVAIEVIDPNGQALLGTYKQVFKTDNITVSFRSFAEYCDSLKSTSISLPK